MRDLAEAIAETERSTRRQSQCCGGVDVQHIYFEGINAGVDGAWEIYWGS
ncbi:hypothetical protein [Nocardia sp. MW-W600-9]